MNIYRKIVPEKIRIKYGFGSYIILFKIKVYYKKVRDDDLLPIIDYIKRKRGFDIFNYSFCENYKDMSVVVRYDNAQNMNYVENEYENRGMGRIYFKKEYDKQMVERAWRNLCMEQDKLSPHCYLDGYNLIKEDYKDRIVFDCGVAEGNFSLDIVEDVEELYLFEGDLEWVSALKETFRKWESKVHIIPYFISNTNEDGYITLDEFVKDWPEERLKKISLIKMDIEGYECRALEGAKFLRSNSLNIQWVICAYHNYGDEKQIRQFFCSDKYKITNSKGYMCCIERGKKGELDGEHFMRRGLLFIKKIFI